jgi:ABC-type transport system involved in cytochrome bd biosynthesis fused ATPase/permease subunit
MANAQNLSGGQRNRLLTALALAKPGELLILDEPTAGLDKKTASALLTELLDELDRQQRTLLLITHDSPAAAKMKQVIHL